MLVARGMNVLAAADQLYFPTGAAAPVSPTQGLFIGQNTGNPASGNPGQII